MTQDMDSKTKALAIVFLVVAGLVLLQMTSLAPLPASTNSFLRGFALGLAIVLVVAFFAGRAGKSNV